MAPLSGTDPRHLGGFRVLTLLAVGGMGRVYLALGPDRRAVALKVARPEFAADARFRARFRREVATARGVGVGGAGAGGAGAGDGRGGGAGGGSSTAGGGRSRGAALIAPVVAADTEAELPWLASEYVPGPSVTEAVMEFGALGEVGLRTLTHGLALALTEVHAAGVVHRDVKPSNVLLARDGPRLIDFGVARAIDDVSLTRVGALIGSPGFLSPEQAVGDPATFGSDIFAMASVVAYAARGQSPFGAGDGPALLYRVVHEPPKLDGIPADLAEVLAACLAKDPAERPAAPEIAARIAPADTWLSDAVLADIARREAELNAWLEVTAADPLWVRAAAEARTTGFDTVADSALDIANAQVPQASHTGTRRRAPAGDDVPRNDQLRGHASDDAPELSPQPKRESPPDHIRQPGLPHRSTRQNTPTAPDLGPQPEPESPANGIRQPGLPRSSTTKPGSAYTAFLLDPQSEPAPNSEPAPRTEPAAANPLPATHRRAPRRRRFPLYAALGAVVGAAVAAVVLLLPHGGHGAPAPPPSQGPVSTGSSSSAPAPGGQKAAPPTPAGGRSGLGQRPGTTSASGSPR